MDDGWTPDDIGEDVDFGGLAAARDADGLRFGPPLPPWAERWALRDLAWWVFEEFRISLDETTVSREVRKLGFRKLSARPSASAPSSGSRSRC